MNYLNLNPGTTNKTLQAGRLLIAEPLLNDPNFSRSVVFLCEHGDHGSLGFVLNNATELKLDDLLPELLPTQINIFNGGPVQVNSMHMLHRLAAIDGGLEIVNGVYWGGSYDALKHTVWQIDNNTPDIRLFMGYSGWGPGQLEQEMEDGSWIIADANPELLFDTRPEDIWKSAIKSLGKKYSFLANVPIDPQLN